MSLKLFSGDILFVQHLLKAEGLYQGELDGIWGPGTDGAAQLFEQRAQQIRLATRAFDMRSENSISTLP